MSCVIAGSGAVGFCTKECSTQSDCPSDYACDAITDADVSVCAPLGKQNVGDSCTNIIDCASNLCIEVDGAGYCTLHCSTNSDCPSTWSCQPTGDPLNICLRP